MANTASGKQKSKVSFAGLYKWNIRLAVIHAVMALLVLLLGATKLFPVQTSYLTLDPIASELAGHPVLAQAMRHLFDINLAYLVAAFFCISAVAHLLMATTYRRTYETNLRKGINKARWIEYAFSASTMMIAIAVLSGVTDLSVLILIFGAVATMNLLGLAMEVYNQGKDEPNWLAYGIGCGIGILPWIVIALYLWGASVYGSGAPAFVYWIYGSLLVFFSCFAVNMYLQYRKAGKWADYLHGERWYMILSLVAKTALGWQVFAGALRP